MALWLIPKKMKAASQVQIQAEAVCSILHLGKSINPSQLLLSTICKIAGKTLKFVFIFCCSMFVRRWHTANYFLTKNLYLLTQ